MRLDGPGTAEDAWVPDACQLPTVERPLRIAEFDSLFSDAIEAEQDGSTRAVIRWRPAPGLIDRITDLTQRETECCSFFGFAVRTPASGDVSLEVTVPPAHADVLGALVVRARACMRHRN